MRIESLDSPTVPHLQLEGFFYVGIIVLAFFALATQKLVHYPLGFMAVAGVFSTNKSKSIEFGISLGIDKSRCYSDYLSMAKEEAKVFKREEGQV